MDTYKDLVKHYEDNLNMMESHLENIKEMLQTKIDRKAMLEEMDDITKALSRLWENLKAKKPEIIQYSIESPQSKTETKSEEKSKK